jgi:hypothetical protein
MNSRTLSRSLVAAFTAAFFCAGAARVSAQVTARSSPSATLMPNGQVLVAGGVGPGGTYLASTEINGVSGGAAMSVARASHTATVLPDGDVLVTGGINGSGVIQSVEVYTPATNHWSLLGNMTTPRYNHTATLLNTGPNSGSVLICGGQIDGAGDVTNACDLFTPSGPGAGSISAGPALEVGCALHTAVILTDGSVWIAGGWNPTFAATSGYLPTTQRLPPGGSFSSITPLNEARAYHTATVMGDGRVLIAGGHNGDMNFNNDQGALETTEIFDPISNSVAPSAPLSIRRFQHTAVLLPDGTVTFRGGLGNITTSYITASGDPFLAGSQLTDNLLLIATGTITGSAATVKLPQITLSVPVSGTIVDGEIDYSSPTAKFTSGIAYFTPASAGGLISSLDGRQVTCQTNSGTTTCGLLNVSSLAMQNMLGSVYFNPLSVSFNGEIDSGNMDLTGPLTKATSPVPIANTSSFQATVEITFPLELAGGTISSGTIYLSGGTLVQSSSYSVTFNSGFGTFAGGAPIVSNGTNGIADVAVTFQNLAGEAAWGGADQSGSVPIPESGAPASGSVSGSLQYVASQVDLSQTATFSVDVATVVIRNMVVASVESYTEKTNATAITFFTGGTNPAFGGYETTQAASVLMPNATAITYGGNDCANAACSALAATTGGVGGAWESHTNDSFAALSGDLNTARAYHTATMLPFGSILVAGGETGPGTSLASAEVFDPTTGKFTAVGPMSVSRSNHTSNLLVNGHVLVAGGFSASPSTGATNSADIFYPKTGIFVPTTPMLTARGNHTATLMPDGTVLVVGGQTSSGGSYLSAVESYSPTAAAWTSLASLPSPLAYHTATLLPDGRLLVVGGYGNSGPTTQVLLYNPTTNAWSSSPAPLPHPLYQHTATLLFDGGADGLVLVAGGNDGNAEYNASYLYNPVTNSWSTTGGSKPLTTARFGHTATLLPDNNVLISGGYTTQGTPVATELEMFNLAISSWTPVGTFASGPRAAHTMTLGLNGDVYAIGGANKNPNQSGAGVYNTAEAGYFTLIADQFTSGAPPSLRQSSITAISASPFQPGGSFNVTGTGFEGGTEASGGGAASADSSFNAPRLLLQQIDSSGDGTSSSGFVLDLTTAVYNNYAVNQPTLNTSLTVPTPPSPPLPFGWYNARVSANGVYSNGKSIQVGPALPTSAPTNITGFALGTSSISWSWGSVAGPIGGYDVYQSSSGVFIGTTAVSATPTFIQTGLQPNTTGDIEVAAYTLSGDGPLLISTTFFTLAAPPTLVQLSSVTPHSVLVQWNVNNNAPGTIYEVSMSTDDFVTSFSTPIPTSLDVTTNSATVLALSAATVYYFRVRAFNEVNLPSDFSAIVSTETTSPVAGVTGVALSPTSIQWSWNATPGATQYDVYVATTGQLDGTSTTTVFTDNNLAVNSARSVLVSAVLAVAGQGPLTPSSTVYTLADQPGLTSPFYQQVSTGGFVVNWTNNGNPVGTLYQVTLQTISSTFTATTNNFFYGVSGLNPSRFAQATINAVNGNGILSAPLVLPSTYTFANPPQSLTVTQTTPNSITVLFDTNGNSTSTYYQVTYSTDDFVTNVSTAVSFSALSNLSTVTISGLLTSTTYWIVAQAENALFVQTAFSNTVSTITSNGGAPPGLLLGVLPAATTGQISGQVGSGETVTLASPIGAFTVNETVLISSYNVPGPLCPGAVNIGVAITATPNVLPMRALNLTLAYTLAQLGAIPPGEATVMRYVPGSGVCVPLNTTANTSALTLTAEINDFGIFLITAPPAFGSADSARAFPNPYHVNRDGYVTIDQIPAGSRVRILDLRGDTVLDQTANESGLVTWSATNGSGRNVSSGLYLVIVEGGGAKKIMKLAVIR